MQVPLSEWSFLRVFRITYIKQGLPALSNRKEPFFNVCDSQKTYN
nr:MAG TPA: hypothetical protein [Caudoviricetes sp.]